MSYVTKINGKVVTQKQSDARLKKKRDTFLIPEDEWLSHPPQIITDDTFFRGQRGGEQFVGFEHLGDEYAKKLIAAGGSPVGKKYMPSLARFPGDPEAWVSTRGEIKDLVGKRGWTSEGQVTVKRPEGVSDPGPDVDLDNDIVFNEWEDRLIDNPEIAPTPKEREELFHKIRDERKPHWAKS